MKTMKTMKKAIYTLCLTFWVISSWSQAPGGVSTGLVTWLKANDGTDGVADGDPVSYWNDQSLTGNHATQAVSSARPLYFSKAINGNGVVMFDGGSRYLDLNLSPISGSEYTIICVAKRSISGTNQFLLGVQQSTPTGMHFGYASNTFIRHFDNGTTANFSVLGHSGATEIPVIMTASFSTSTGRALREIRNGATRTASSANLTPMTFTGLGAIGRGAGSTGLNGYIAEVIVYNRTLTSAENRQIQTYLSVKYGLTIAVSNHLYYNHTSFPHDLVSLGRNMATQELAQIEGNCENSDNILKVSNPSDLNDGEYWVAGNQNGSMSFAPASLPDCSYSTMLGRVWRVRETGNVGTVDLQFNLQGLTSIPESVMLILDRNNNGYNDETPISGTYNAPFMTFSGVNIRSGYRITLVERVDNWYAVADGNSSDAIWSKSPAGSPQILTTGCIKTNIIIPSGRNVNATSALNCKDFTVEAGAIFTHSSNTLTLSGNFTSYGSYVPVGGTIVLNGTAAQSIQGAAEINMNSLQINNAAGVSILSQPLNLRGQLLVTSGTLNTNDLLVLDSGPTYQGSIGPLTSGNIIGHVTVRRYRQALANGWFNLCAPVQGQTINEWNDDLITTGFPGADYPSYSMNSIMWYDETLSPSAGTEYVGATGLSNPTSNLKGFYAYTNSGVINLDVTGNIYKGPVTLPVSYTYSGSASTDGWNLVANPYPSAIDWDAAGWTKTNINNAVYVWDAQTGQYASYVNGIGTNGGTNLIPSTQSFFVVANANSPVLSLSEPVKSSDQGAFKSNSAYNDFISLEIDNGKQKDQVVLAFDYSASAKFDGHADAYKLTNPLQAGHFLALLDESKNEYSIQTLGDIEDGMIIPLRMHGAMPGDFTLRWTAMPDWTEGFTLLLENVRTGQSIPMDHVNAINLYLEDETTSNQDWQIRITKTGHSELNEGVYATGRIDENGLTLLMGNTEEKTLEIYVWNLVGQALTLPARFNTSVGRIVIDCGGYVGPCIVQIRDLNSGATEVLKLAP
jgi:hypothetical protein